MSAKTMAEFIREVGEATETLRVHTKDCVSVAAGCELFTRTVTRYANDPEVCLRGQPPSDRVCKRA